MLKRSKTDDTAAGSGGGSTIGVVNDDADAGELIARLVEATGRTATRLRELDEVVDEVATSSEYGGVIIDSLHCGINRAMELLDGIRGADDAQVARLPVVILAASDANRLFAFQAGADAFVVRPFHADELVEELDTVLARSADEREQFRQSQLLGGAAAG